ncbi:MAG: DUF4286 family protein [Muribaculaceae bacterium]|nr:DUF4286 family protein [Muribaculaceae bacterium]
MILFNTTFHLDATIESEFLTWLKLEFIPAAISSGFEKPLLCRIVDNIEPGCAAFALQFFASTMSDVDNWRAGRLCGLIATMSTRWKDRALAFSTPMEVINL